MRHNEMTSMFESDDDAHAAPDEDECRCDELDHPVVLEGLCEA